MSLLPGLVVAAAALLGLVLTLLTLPGMWVALAVALLAQWWQPGMFSWWTLGVGLGLAVSGEIAELAASAAGARVGGAGRKGAAASMLGGIVGALAGTALLPIPVFGTLAGAVAGAGLGTLLAERGIDGRSWGHSIRAGGGAAAGRFAAVIIKAVLAVALSIILIGAAFID